jgi:hypothetical protein
LAFILQLKSISYGSHITSMPKALLPDACTGLEALKAKEISLDGGAIEKTHKDTDN